MLCWKKHLYRQPVNMEEIMKRKNQFLLGCVLFFWGQLPVHADDVLDAINEAITSYKNNAYSDAVENLDYAKQLIQQAQNEGIVKYLPNPLQGWNADTAQSQNTGMFGGVASVEREYRKPGSDDLGDSQVTITVLGKSPIMQGMMAMFNPMIAGADGGRLQKIQGNKAIVKYDPGDRSGEITVQVDDRYIVSIKGNSVGKEDLMLYADAVDYKGLEGMK